MAQLLPPLIIAPSSPPPPAAATLIIGGGLSGLAAATHLHSSNLPFLLLESSDSLGGRVRTDSVDGFLLDRGFQILLTAYPEARRLLHLPSLRLRPFYPGALVFHSSRFHLLSDPLRRPFHSLLSLPNPIGSLSDKLLLALHRFRYPSAPETSISLRLQSLRFSSSIIDRFFRPFLAGIFLDPDLSTSSLLFDFIFRCLAQGDNALPALGIGAIPAQLAANLPSSSIRLHSEVLSVATGTPPVVTLAGGESLAAPRGVIVAVDRPAAERLVPRIVSESASRRPARSTVCIYFVADRAPVREPVLILNGSGEGMVNNMCFPTNVAPSYGPPGGPALVSVSVVGDGGGDGRRSDEDLAAEVLRELGGWFGPEEVATWRLLRTYRIGFAQPDQSPPTEVAGKDPRVGDGVYMCGDHWSSATFDGALVSGRRAAEALIRDLVPAPPSLIF